MKVEATHRVGKVDIQYKTKEEVTWLLENLSNVNALCLDSSSEKGEYMYLYQNTLIFIHGV